MLTKVIVALESHIVYHGIIKSQMKKILIFFAFTILSCTKSENKVGVTVDFTICRNRFICIEIHNYSSKKIYIPEIRGLGAGLKIYAMVGNNYMIDISDTMKLLSLDAYRKIEYNEVKEVCSLYNSSAVMTDSEKIIIAEKIVMERPDLSPSLNLRIKERAIRLFNEMIFLDPGQSYIEYFPLPDSFGYMNIGFYYFYPYKYPIIQSGPNRLSSEELDYNLKMLDSLRFSYPKSIQGYNLFNTIICSSSVVMRF
jgi:hypothetical protein